MHFFMNEVFAAPASGLPSLPYRLAVAAGHLPMAEPTAKVASTAATIILFELCFSPLPPG